MSTAVDILFAKVQELKGSIEDNHAILLDLIDTAFEEGVESGQGDGYDVGYSEGYESGREEGYDAGYAEGTSDGYDQCIHDRC